MKPTLLLLLAVMAATPLRAAEDARFGQANQAFAAEHYDEAIAGYQAILADRGQAAPVLFNLANAYYRTGKIGLALAHYEQARLLAPRDPAIAANQATVLRKIGLPTEAPIWKRACGWLSPNEWAWTLTGALFLGSILGFLLYLRRTASGAIRGLVFLCGLAAVASVAALLFWNGELRQAWVIAPDAPALISPFEAAKPAFTLSDGAAVTVEGHHDDYFLVRDAKGETGWLRKGQVATLLPGKA